MKLCISRQIIFALVILLVSPIVLCAQSDRFVHLEQKLDMLAGTEIPALNSSVDASFSEVSIQDFIRALGKTSNLNISIDPEIKVQLVNNFSDAKAKDVVLFLCKKYQLDLDFTGNIVSIQKYIPPPKAPAQAKVLGIDFDKNTHTISLDLSNDTLAKVVKKMVLETGENIIPAAGLGNEKVSIFIRDVNLEEALKQLTYANDLNLEKSEDNIFYLKRKTPGLPQQTTQANQGGGGRSSRNRAGSGNFSIQIDETNPSIPLISLDAQNASISDIIQSLSERLGYGYFVLDEPQKNVTSMLKGVPYEGVLSHLLGGTGLTYKKTGNTFLIGKLTSGGLGETKIIPLLYRTVDKLSEVIPNDLKTGLQIVEFKEQNSLVVNGAATEIARLEKFITEIDLVVPLVTIDVIIMDYNKNRANELGLTAGIADAPVTTNGQVFPDLNVQLGGESINEIIGILNGYGLFNLGSVSERFYMNIQALESDDVVSIQSVPRLATLNGHEATLRIGQTRYYEAQTRDVIAAQSTTTVVTQEFREARADLAIDIVPIVSGDGEVTLDIKVEISDFLETPTNAPPPTATRQFTSMVRVQDGETIVLGGLLDKRKSESGRGVPILSRIPILKWFFSNRSRNKREGQLVVFIKPTVSY